MQKTGLVVVAFILSGLIISCNNSDYGPAKELNNAKKTGKMLYVMDTTDLNIRSMQSSKGDVIVKAMYGDQVELLKADVEAKELFAYGIHGNWIPVEYKGKRGYLFDGFLSRFEAPAKGQKFASYMKNLAKKEGLKLNSDGGDGYSAYTVNIQNCTPYDIFNIANACEYFNGRLEKLPTKQKILDKDETLVITVTRSGKKVSKIALEGTDDYNWLEVTKNNTGVEVRFGGPK